MSPDETLNLGCSPKHPSRQVDHFRYGRENGKPMLSQLKWTWIRDNWQAYKVRYGLWLFVCQLKLQRPQGPFWKYLTGGDIGPFASMIQETFWNAQSFWLNMNQQSQNPRWIRLAQHPILCHRVCIFCLQKVLFLQESWYSTVISMKEFQGDRIASQNRWHFMVSPKVHSFSIRWH